MKRKYCLWFLMGLMLGVSLLLAGCGSGSDGSGSSDGEAAVEEQAEEKSGPVKGAKIEDYYDKNGLDFDLASCLEDVYGMKDVEPYEWGDFLVGTTSKGDLIEYSSTPIAALEHGVTGGGGLSFFRERVDGHVDVYNMLIVYHLESEPLVVFRSDAYGEEMAYVATQEELDVLFELFDNYEQLSSEVCPFTGSGYSHSATYNVIPRDPENEVYDVNFSDATMEDHEPH